MKLVYRGRAGSKSAFSSFLRKRRLVLSLSLTEFFDCYSCIAAYMKVQIGKMKTASIVAKAASKAPNFPTYGYQMASDIGGKVIITEIKIFIVRDSFISLWTGLRIR